MYESLFLSHKPMFEGDHRLKVKGVLDAHWRDAR
jgi:hypothetical protein